MAESVGERRVDNPRPPDVAGYGYFIHRNLWRKRLQVRRKEEELAEYFMSRGTTEA